MPKNSDLNNIFSSYMDKVLLKEAVRSVDNTNGKMPSNETLQATRERLKQQTAQELNKMRDSMVAQGIPMGSNVRVNADGTVSRVDQPTQPAQQAAQQTTQTQQTTQPPKPSAVATPPPQQSQAVPQAQQIKSNSPASAQSPAPAQQPPKPSAVATPPQQDQNVPVKRAQNPYATDYQGASIVDFLNKSGQASNFKARQAMAQRMGIQNYKGTAEQNTQLLNTLKQKAQEFEKTPQVATPQQVAQASQPQLNVSATQSPSLQAVQQMKAAPEQFKMQTPQQSGTQLAQGPTQAAAAQQATQQSAQQAPATPTQQQASQQSPFMRDLTKLAQNIYGGANQSQQQVASSQKPAKPEAAEEEANEENCEDCEENCEECEKMKRSALNKITVQEKINISKFLKHLSEKNYSSAHKYLRAIVDEKVKTKIAQRIAKN